jgi:hypothetical protein
LLHDGLSKAYREDPDHPDKPVFEHVETQALSDQRWTCMEL